MKASSRRGDISELIASTWLLEQNYEVFRNLSSIGMIDIVAIKDGVITLIDVKTASKNWKQSTQEWIYYETKSTKNQEAMDVKYLYVTHDGQVAWDILKLGRERWPGE